ncbi:MAG: phosphoribosylformylglycinamidine synthase subunit PurS [Myxococcota bacterium]
MAKYKGTARVTLKREVLDPQGDAVRRALGSLGHGDVSRVRVGKLIEIDFEADDVQAAEGELRAMGKKLLANAVIEDFAFDVKEA